MAAGARPPCREVSPSLRGVSPVPAHPQARLDFRLASPDTTTACPWCYRLGDRGVDRSAVLDRRDPLTHKAQRLGVRGNGDSRIHHGESRRNCSGFA